MSYDPTKLNCLTPRMGSGPALWNYASTDAHGSVSGTDYFTNGKKAGMMVGDPVIVHDTDAPTVTIHRVTEVDAAGNATISAATLA